MPPRELCPTVRRLGRVGGVWSGMERYGEVWRGMEGYGGVWRKMYKHYTFLRFRRATGEFSLQIEIEMDREKTLLKLPGFQKSS